MKCEACDRDVEKPVWHHWFDESGNIHFRNICPRCNSHLTTPTNSPDNHVLPDWETQRRSCLKNAEQRELVEATYKAWEERFLAQRLLSRESYVEEYGMTFEEMQKRLDEGCLKRYGTTWSEHLKDLEEKKREKRRQLHRFHSRIQRKKKREERLLARFASEEVKHDNSNTSIQSQT